MQVSLDSKSLRNLIEIEARSLGFQGLRISKATISEPAQAQFDEWLERGYHGSMAFMERHAPLRKDPSKLFPGAKSIISVQLPYWHEHAIPAKEQLKRPENAYISRYALGRDYHKIVRHRLQKLAIELTKHIGMFSFRAFSDSAPIMEVALASQSGLGWKGKHTLSLTRQGSWYFLGELICDLALETDLPIDSHCGNCTKCMDACPTGAITAPYEVDARRCISYLTIEHKGEVPVSLRKAIGNRIYGCDDCQLTCPWNKFATTGDTEFQARHHLDSATLLDLFAWTEQEFNDKLAGSAIRRIGFEQWQRNISVALGNSISSPEIVQALEDKKNHSSDLVKLHIEWALAELRS